MGAGALTEKDLEAIELLVIKTMRANQSELCRFSVTDKEAAQLAHVLGMMADIGGGDLAQGIENSRANHKWLKELREKSNTASTIFFGLIVLTVGGGLLSALWLGVKALFVGAR